VVVRLTCCLDYERAKAICACGQRHLGVRPERVQTNSPDVLVASVCRGLEDKIPAGGAGVLVSRGVISTATGHSEMPREEGGVQSAWRRVRTWPSQSRPAQPRSTVFEWDGGEYRQVAHVIGAEAFEAQRPFPGSGGSGGSGQPACIP